MKKRKFLALLCLFSFLSSAAVFSATQNVLSSSPPTPNLKAFTKMYSFSDLEQISFQGDIEYKTILDFIQTKFKSIRPENAELIASELVKQGKFYEMDPKFVAAIMAVESGFNHKAYHYGAMGLGQIMRGNLKNFGIEDPYSITQNVMGTTKHVKDLLTLFRNQSFQIQLTLSSYLLGTHKVVKKHLFDERTHRYVGAVLSRYQVLRALSEKLQTDH